MTPAEKRRWVVLGGALSLTLGATLWLAVNERSQDMAEAVMSEPAQPRKLLPESETSSPRGADMLRPLIESEPVDVFVGKANTPVVASGERSKTMTPPVAAMPQPAAMEPVVPTAPPLPFTYTGKLIEDGAYTVFLAKQDKNIVVKPGDVLDQVWRVEDIKPPLMTFIYLPMNTKLTLQIGEAN